MNSIKLISLAALATSLMPSWAAQKQNKPNIIFVISDDHSVPFLGCYGNKDIKTPNFDKFASEGMTFTRTYVTAPQSAPSRFSQDVLPSLLRCLCFLCLCQEMSLPILIF